jgi:hypothetical protein
VVIFGDYDPAQELITAIMSGGAGTTYNPARGPVKGGLKGGEGEIFKTSKEFPRLTSRVNGRNRSLWKESFFTGTLAFN